MKKAKTRSEAQSTQSCVAGCKGRILVNGKYCRCIEKLLPKMSRGSLAAIPTGEKIERSPFRPEPRKTELSKSQVYARLAAFGLETYEIDLLYLRFYEELTFAEIVRRCGWTSKGSASHAYKTALGKLRKRSFKF